MVFCKTFLVVVWCCGVRATEIPDFIKVCHRGHPDMEQCLIESVDELRHHLVSGVPEYHIPSIEPLVMKDLICEEAAGMKITTTNVSAYGCSDFVLKRIDTDLENHAFKMFIDIPKLRIEADYKVDGKILLLPVRGNGNLEANVTECESVCHLQGELYEKDGAQYIRYTSIDIHVKIGGGQVRMENLFNGDKLLLGMMNDVINKNLDMFLGELMPGIEKGLSRTFLDIANKIVEKFSYDELFPE